MKSEYITPFIDAVINTLKTMMGIEAVPGAPALRKPGEASLQEYQFCGLIGFSGVMQGRVAIGFKEEVARKVVAAFVASPDPGSLSENEVSDGVGEMTNMVAGAAKAALHKSGDEVVSISIPNVLAGPSLEIVSPRDHASIVVPFETHCGALHLEVAFKTGR